MTVCIDIGCANYGGDYSIERLIEEFAPSRLYGFDPSKEGPYIWEADQTIGNTTVRLQPWAASTYDGHCGFLLHQLIGHVDQDADHQVRCFDLAAFILSLPPSEIVLKIDAEGAEYSLLEHLIAQKADLRLKLAWVEWHELNESHYEKRAYIEDNLRCELREWLW